MQLTTMNMQSNLIRIIKMFGKIEEMNYLNTNTMIMQQNTTRMQSGLIRITIIFG